MKSSHRAREPIYCTRVKQLKIKGVRAYVIESRSVAGLNPPNGRNPKRISEQEKMANYLIHFATSKLSSIDGPSPVHGSVTASVSQQNHWQQQWNAKHNGCHECPSLVSAFPHPLWLRPSEIPAKNYLLHVFPTRIEEKTISLKTNEKLSSRRCDSIRRTDCFNVCFRNFRFLRRKRAGEHIHEKTKNSNVKSDLNRFESLRCPTHTLGSLLPHCNRNLCTDARPIFSDLMKHRTSTWTTQKCGFVYQRKSAQQTNQLSVLSFVMPSICSRTTTTTTVRNRPNSALSRRNYF